jgi:septal ring factor EnvC (AmiA/AmiB activator)
MSVLIYIQIAEAIILFIICVLLLGLILSRPALAPPPVDPNHINKLDFLISNTNTIIMNQQDLLQQMQDINAELKKGIGEVVQKIADLETAVGNSGNTTPEVDAAIAELKKTAEALDGIVPDAPGDGSPADTGNEEPAAGGGSEG